MDTRVKPAYDELWLPPPSTQLIDPHSLSRRQGGENRRLGSGQEVGVGVAVGLHVRRLGRAGVGRGHRGRCRTTRNTAHGKILAFALPDCDEAEAKAL